jgi:hypothetical protein
VWQLSDSASVQSSSRSTSDIQTQNVCDLPADRKELDACGDRFGINARYTDYSALLADPNVDAVHINSPIADHAPQSIAALKRANMSPAPFRRRRRSTNVARSWNCSERAARST